MTPSDYTRLLAIARRHARGPAEAGDLLHDALLVAHAAEVDLAREAGQRWLSGVIRNVARGHARTEARRRRRESEAAPPAGVEPAVPGAPRFGAHLLAGVPPASRRVVELALHGLERHEVRAVLGLTDAAFRQRLAGARRALGAVPAEVRTAAVEAACADQARRRSAVDTGPMRRALQRGLAASGAVGAHDPDGHLVMVG